MKQKFKDIIDWLEDRLKDLCGEITPDKRLIVILLMLLIFTLANLYFTFSSFYEWGKESQRQEQLKIEHLKELKLPESAYDARPFTDSILYIIIEKGSNFYLKSIPLKEGF